MNAYIEIARKQAHKHVQYRAAAISSIVTQLFFGIIRIESLLAFYASTQADLPLSIESTVTYIWLTQMLFAIISLRPDPEVAALVKDGTLAYEMIRPIRLSLAWYARAWVNRIMPTMMRFIPILVIVHLLPKPLGIRIGFSPIASVSFLVSIILAFFLAGAIANLVNVIVVYLMSANGIARTIPIVMFFLSGITLPIPLMPTWVQGVAYALPFVGIMDFPVRILTGDIVGYQIVIVMLHQIIWCLVLMLMVDRLLEKRLKNATIFGG